MIVIFQITQESSKKSKCKIADNIYLNYKVVHLFV